MKRLIAALVLSAFLVTVGLGCGGPSSPAKPAPGGGGEKKDDKKTQ